MLILGVCLASLIVSFFAVLGLSRQNARIERLEGELDKLRGAQLGVAPSALPDPVFIQPVLEGLRIAISMQQDHEHPTFAVLLKERLISEDADVTLPDSSGNINDSWDILIRGSVACNGYSETFYEANLECLTRSGALVTISEKPPHGGRQANLASAVVTQLKHELESAETRRERREALEQLRELN